MEGESSCQHPAVHKSNSLTVLYFNARSIIPKFDALCSEVEIHKPDLICITETWLSEEVSDSEIALAGYQLHRLDRNRQGGGILIYVHTALTTEIIYQGPLNLEFLAISVQSSVNKFCISLFYRPPSSPRQVMDDLYTSTGHLTFFKFCTPRRL